MKRINNVLKIAGAGVTALLALLLLTGCFSDMDITNLPDKGGIPAGMGEVRLSVQGAAPQAKTVFPDVMDSLTYTAAFSLNSENVSLALTNGSGTIRLKPGTWTLVIEAKDGGTIVGRTSKQVAVTVGQTTSVEDIFIQPITDDADPDYNTGSLSWETYFPTAAVDYAVLEITKKGGSAVTIDLLDDQSQEWADYAITETADTYRANFDLEPGSYLIRIVLRKTEGSVTKRAGKAETVHIYPTLTSSVGTEESETGKWIFHETSFSNTEEATGYVTFIYDEALITITGVDLNSGIGGNFDEAYFTKDTTNPKQWNFEATVIEDAAHLIGAYFEITTAANDALVDVHGPLGIVLQTAPANLPLGSDLENVDLGSITLWALDAAAGANGKISVKGCTPATAIRADYLDGDTVVLTAIPEPTFEVEFTGVPASGSIVGNTATFTINGNTTIAAAFVGTTGWVLYNQTAPSGTTTVTMPAMDDTTKKFTITNANSNAKFEAGSGQGVGGVVDSTIVFLNQPLATNSSIIARVRITGRGGASSGTNGVIVGLMGTPTGTDVPFMGMRVTAQDTATWQAYFSRTGTNGNSGQALSPAKTGAFTEEFILETVRTGAQAFTVNLRDKDTGAVLATVSRTSSNSVLDITNAYAGFIISNVTVEISPIEIKSGGTTIFSAPTLGSVAIGPADGDAISPDNEIAVSIGKLQLEAAVAPSIVSQVVSWDVISGAGSVDANGLVTFSSTPGEITVEAASVAASATKTFTIDVKADSAINVTSVIISEAEDAADVLVGNELVFSAVTAPAYAAPGVTWSVAHNAAGTNTTGIEDIATITQSGVLTGVGAGTVYVIAASKGGSPAKVESYKVEVFAPQAPETVVITPPAAAAFMAGESITLTAVVGPAGAPQDVVWTVFEDETAVTPTIIATFVSDSANPATLTAAKGSITVETDVYVVAAAAGMAIESAPVKITITVPPAGPVLMKATIGAATNVSTVWDDDENRLTMTGTGASDGSNIRLNFIYTEIDASDDFTAIVKIHSYSANANNNSKAGIFAIKSDGEGDIITTAAGQVWYASVLNNTAAKVAEYYTGRNELTGNLSFPGLLRLTKTGNSYQVSYSNNNGESWTSGSSRTLTTLNGAKIFLGLGVSSNSTDVGRAVFSDFTIDFGEGPINIDLSQVDD